MILNFSPYEGTSGGGGRAMVRGLVPRVGAELRLWSQRPGVRHHRGPGRGQVAYDRGRHGSSSQGSVTTDDQVEVRLLITEVNASVARGPSLQRSR